MLLVSNEGPAKPDDTQPYSRGPQDGQEWPTYAQQPSSAPQYPGYGPPMPGYGYPFARAHGRATTSMVLGLIAVAALVTGPFVCCVTLPGVFTAPFAIWTGLSARREIDLNPVAWTNRGQAVAGFVLGIVVSALAVLLLLAAVVLFAGVGGSSVFDTGY